MKTFRFLAKQGQHDQVARLLFGRYGVKPRVGQYDGPRGQGVMITLPLPPAISKTMVDKFLHLCLVGGSKSRKNKNKPRIFREGIMPWQIADAIGYNVPFRLSVSRGRRRGLRKAQIVMYQPGCTCCGPYTEIEFAD